ncbi:MAG TPA: HAD domain-containing protein [Lachnospiraceae bacterium]|nr:HAD domain-containing protein [Lachnospiraceae bacterium]
MNKRIIFLDIDGVLNSNFWNESHQREISDGSLIDAEKVRLLGEIIRRTSADIVLHSGWRFWFNQDLEPNRKEAERLVELLENEGLTISDVTPDLTTEEIRRTRKFSLVKASEIFEWLKQHPEVEQWVVLDDLDLHNIELAKHQIKTNQVVGLTKEDVELAVTMLTKTNA